MASERRPRVAVVWVRYAGGPWLETDFASLYDALNAAHKGEIDMGRMRRDATNSTSTKKKTSTKKTSTKKKPDVAAVDEVTGAADAADEGD